MVSFHRILNAVLSRDEHCSRSDDSDHLSSRVTYMGYKHELEVEYQGGPISVNHQMGFMSQSQTDLSHRHPSRFDVILFVASKTGSRLSVIINNEPNGPF